MRDAVPLNCARIEWQPNGKFRISHFDNEPPNWKLRLSGGACFASWTDHSAQVRELWFLWHAIMAMEDGCDPQQVISEMNRVPELFDMVNRFMVRPSEVEKAQMTRGKEAKDGQDASE